MVSILTMEEGALCFSPDPDLAHPMFESLRRWMGMNEVPPRIPIEFTIAALDQAGVERALLSAWWGPEGPHIGNDEVAAHVSAYPQRLAGIASVDLHRPMAAVRELRRCVRELGFRGLRVLPWLWGLPPNDRRYYPLYAECIYLDEVAVDFPELVIVAGHIGYPWTQEMIALATKYKNVYIDTSAYKPSRYPPELVSYLRGHGSKKVLFGSNHPMITPGACLAELAALGLDETASRRFLHDNAAAVFGL